MAASNAWKQAIGCRPRHLEWGRYLPTRRRIRPALIDTLNLAAIAPPKTGDKTNDVRGVTDVKSRSPSSWIPAASTIDAHWKTGEAAKSARKTNRPPVPASTLLYDPMGMYSS